MCERRELAHQLLRLQDQELGRLRGLVAAAVGLAEALAETSSAGSAHRGLAYVAREAEDVVEALDGKVGQIRRQLAPPLAGEEALLQAG